MRICACAHTRTHIHTYTPSTVLTSNDIIPCLVSKLYYVFMNISFVLDPYDAIDIGHNLALWKPTKQSSYDLPKKYTSSMAVDGDTTVYGSSAHTRTSWNVEGWWQVDLESVYEIRVVVITSKLEQCNGINFILSI